MKYDFHSCHEDGVGRCIAWRCKLLQGLHVGFADKAMSKTTPDEDLPTSFERTSRSPRIKAKKVSAGS